MPFHIKLGLSIAVALVVLCGWFYMGYAGKTGPQWALAFLGPFSIISLWIFPEVMRSKADTRKARDEQKQEKA